MAFACVGSPNLPLPWFDEETWNTCLNGNWGCGTCYEFSKMCGWEAKNEALVLNVLREEGRRCLLFLLDLKPQNSTMFIRDVLERGPWMCQGQS